jgi:hypothetical protein
LWLKILIGRAAKEFEKAQFQQAGTVQTFLKTVMA